MKFAKLFPGRIHRFLAVLRLRRASWLSLFVPFVLLHTAWASPPLDINSPQVQTVMALQERVTDEWMRHSGVLGTAVGLDSDGRPALVVYIDRDAVRAAEIVGILPKSIDGVKVLA